MTPETALWAVAAGSALAYGLIFVARPVGFARTLVKTGSVAALSALAYLDGGSELLAVALAFCALGDAFLAGDPKRWLPFGLGAFLVGHLVYIPLFLERSGAPPTWFWPAAAGVGATAALMLRALWGALGKLKIPVAVYVLAIVGMVLASLLLPARAWPTTAGALGFMASDAILSFELFKGAKLLGSPRLTSLAVWGLYWGGQAGICWGMLAL
ncbi:lysoplasmalogenase [uncultured Caulobacter sp.]|uniref:lysoplasmalogenase n=1 Tax=uncultured Caulobacter sp. TaxID=158749 RepID=UPI00260D4019|nr:lysoplasmalogenase [uncultured Caulobacter sp.]